MSAVPVKPKLLIWARERAGITQDALVIKFKKLPEWERGSAYPTFKQLEAFARAVRVPFGYLFLNSPPEERIPIPDFRTVSEKKKRGDMSPDLMDTIHAMLRRQRWLHEYLIGQKVEPLFFAESAHLTDPPDMVGREMRKIVGIGDGWAATVANQDVAVNQLRRMIEKIGVMAVINGVVGNNTHRQLKVEEFRGFALADPYAPLIFVNGRDAKSAQMFTLAHELAHIWLGEEGISGFEHLLPDSMGIEAWCNQAAAEFLMPSNEFYRKWRQFSQERVPYEPLKQFFKVSPVVIARRAMDLDLIDRDQFLVFYQGQTKQRGQKKRMSGGDFYNNQNARVGRYFATHIISAAKGGEIGFKEAYDLTGLYGGTFQTYAERLGIRIR